VRNADFLTRLQELGVKLWVEGETVRYSAPKNVLTEPLRAEMARRKEEILEALRDGQQAASCAPPPLVRQPRSGEIRLSFAQERLWFVDQLEPNNPAYNIPLAVRVTGPLHVGALQLALREIVRRHEILRTTCSVMNGQLVQVVCAAMPFRVRLIDLSGAAEVGQEAAVGRLAAEEVRRPFDLSRGPFVRACLLKLADTEHVLLLTAHHFVADGWSMTLFYRELSILYDAFCADKQSPLPELPIQYADFAQWQRRILDGDMVNAQLAYWKEQLDGAPAILELPTDRLRPAAPTHRGACEAVVLSKRLSEALKAFSRREGVTLFMTLMAAFQTLIHRYTSHDDVVVGTAVSNRNHIETEGLIGPFANNLVLRTDFSGNPPFRAILQRVRKTAIGAYAHQDLPFEKLVEALHPTRGLAHHPLFQVMFILHQQDQEQSLRLKDLSLSILPIEIGTARYDLFLDLTDGPQICGSIEYSTELFERSTIDRLLGHFENLLEGIVAGGERRVSELPLFSSAERAQLLVEWNRTGRTYGGSQCIHELIEAQAERSPDAVAVVFEQTQLTYGELNERANRLARYLRNKGVGCGALVGIYVERSLEMVVGLLGILKAGGAYVPLDPGFPRERLAFMMADAGLKLVVTQRELAGEISEGGWETICLDTDWPAIARESHAQVGVEVAGEERAYVIYTSGSTGKPKGVEITHRSVVNFLNSMRERPGMTERDVLLAVTTISFDIAGLEIYLPLTAGARVVIASGEVAADGTQLGQSLARCEATVMQATPATWTMLIGAGWQGSKGLKILCGGESLSGELSKQLLERGESLWNVYGPTETTIWSALYRVERAGECIPIGRPIANTQIYILDRDRQPVPIGVVGELYIGGDGLARGYLNRAELTQEKFISDPFSADPQARLYRTGDLARYLPDGNIECLGRIDHQVKVRGFRIELGEIESVLLRCRGVKESVAVVREDAPGDKRLVAYWVADQAPAPKSEELRNFLKERLPNYMVPSIFVQIDKLPLTPNGKVDRRSLPAPEHSEESRGQQYVAPRTEIEQVLAAIWAEVLKVPRVGIHDNFFDLGGHSLLAVQVIRQIAKVLGKTLPVRALFHAPTVQELAAALRDQDPKRNWAAVVPLQPRGSRPPFFFLAGRSHFGDRLGSDQPVYRVVYQDLDQDRPFARIEDMAAYAIENVRRIQPEGPYYLGGHGHGGMVAFEMAQQLLRNGQKIAALILCESWTQQSRASAAGTSAVYRLWQKASYRLSRARRAGVRRELAALFGSLKKKGRHIAWRGESAAGTRSQQDDTAALFAALKQYRPPPYPGRITLIRCSQRVPWERYDPLYGWGKIAAAGVDAYEIAGTHTGIYKEPHVAALAKALNEVLREAQASSTNEHGTNEKNAGDEQRRQIFDAVGYERVEMG
jgi:aspartate racemase